MLAKGKRGGLETTIRLPLLKTQAPNQTATVESAE